MMPPVNEWQYVDDWGIVMPWFTNHFLHELNRWDLSGVEVLEIGAGQSTKWWMSRGAYVATLETNQTWLEDVQRDISIGYAGYKEVSFTLIKTIDDVVNAVSGNQFDIIVIDNDESVIDRCEIAKAVWHACRRGGKIILDNANRAEFDAVHKLLQFNVHHSYPQDGHPDWRTDYWEMNTTERWDHLGYEQAAANMKRLRGSFQGLR